MMKSFDYYKTPKTPYPNKRDYIYYQVNEVLSGKVLHKKLSEDKLNELGFATVSKTKEVARQTLDDVEYLVIYHFDEAEYKEQFSKNQSEGNALMLEFERDVKEKHSAHPDSKLAGVIYREAYERGHSAGIEEVDNYYSTISDLADDIINAYLDDTNNGLN